LHHQTQSNEIVAVALLGLETLRLPNSSNHAWFENIVSGKDVLIGATAGEEAVRGGCVSHIIV
jgi:hypothetical protein